MPRILRSWGSVCVFCKFGIRLAAFIFILAGCIVCDSQACLFDGDAHVGISARLVFSRQLETNLSSIGCQSSLQRLRVRLQWNGEMVWASNHLVRACLYQELCRQLLIYVLYSRFTDEIFVLVQQVKVKRRKQLVVSVCAWISSLVTQVIFKKKLCQATYWFLAVPDFFLSLYSAWISWTVLIGANLLTDQPFNRLERNFILIDLRFWLFAWFNVVFLCHF